MELALQVLGIKLTGKVEDPKHVAMRIVGSAGSSDSQNTTDVSNMMQLASTGLSNSSQRDIGRLLLGGAAQDPAEFERLILNVLSLLDVKMDSASPFSVTQAISYQTDSGQTLLHLAVALDLSVVVEFLLSHGIDYDLRDRNGWTALHFAAASGATDCAKMLVAAGADLHVVNARGQLPRELGPRDFFDGMHQDVVDADPEPVYSDREAEDEAMWGDAEEDSGDEARRRVNRRRGGRRTKQPASTSELRGTFLASAPTTSDDLPSEKKSLAPPVDEKHAAAATYADVLLRTLAQLQRPTKGVFPHLADLPGVRAVPWSALPQIPMVFPVFVPTPAWPAFLDKRSASCDGASSSAESEPPTPASPGGAPKSARRPVSAAVKTANEWIAFWERLMQGMAASAPQQEVEEVAPPVYTPRAPSPEVPVQETATPQEAKETATLQETPAERAVARRTEYPPAPSPETDVDAYEYRPVKKTLRLKKKEDRMLVLFWVPALFGALLFLVDYLSTLLTRTFL